MTSSSRSMRKLRILAKSCGVRFGRFFGSSSRRTARLMSDVSLASVAPHRSPSIPLGLRVRTLNRQAGHWNGSRRLRGTILLRATHLSRGRARFKLSVWVCQGQVRRAKLWHSSAGCSRKSPRTNAESPRTARGPMQQLGLKRVF